MARRLLIGIGIVLLAACQPGDVERAPEQVDLEGILAQLPGPSPTPTVTPTPNNTSTRRAASTNRPRTTTPRPTRTPTSTPDPSIPTAAPEGWQVSGPNGLLPNRKWFIFSREDTGQIGGFNVDGSGFTWFDLPPVVEMRYWNQMATWRNYVAYVTEISGRYQYELIIARFPVGEVIYRTSIFDPDLGGDYLRKDTLGTMDWSPDGEHLVVSASPHSTDTDLYIYRKTGNRFEQLTSEPGYAFQPRWSDDGEWIEYREMAKTGEGSGHEIERRRNLNLNTREMEVFNRDYQFHGGCGGDGTNYEEQTDNLGKSTAYVMTWWFGEDRELLANGVYIQNQGDDQPRLIYRVDWTARGLEWEKEAEMFRAEVYREGFEGYIFFDRNGTIRHEFKEIEFSADASMLAVKDIYDRLVIYELDKGLNEIWLIEDPPIVSQFYWQPDGRGLIIEALGHLYHVHMVRREVSLIARDLAGEFYINNGYWISQSP